MKAKSHDEEEGEEEEEEEEEQQQQGHVDYLRVIDQLKKPEL